jgi:geranylgeranyl pyrophosphate synthase
MGQIRNSDGYRKNISKDGMRSPHISEKIAKKIDVIAKHKGINFTKACEEALDKYAKDYIDSLDLIERQELLELLWSEV